MKKKTLIGLVALLVVGWIVYSFVINTIVGLTKDFEPYTFERVLEDSVMNARYGLTNQESPTDYGYENVDEVTFYSSLDNLELSGWYVNSAPDSKQTVIIVHGRTSNRLKTMKYLELFKETGLDTVFNFFIPDMRNSGKSTPASTYMGYKFAEDIHGAVSYLKAKGQEKFVIYGFSMGALATSTLLHRDDLPNPDNSIIKVILESPLSDAKGNINISADEMSLPNFIFENAYAVFSEEMNNYGEQMAMGIQLKNVDIPILIIQSNDDAKTPASLTKNQLKQLEGKTNIQTWFMDGPEHVRIYTTEEFKGKYTMRVDEFLRE
jgi:pimeloyl-ACP methyl ester carboxylesterase